MLSGGSLPGASDDAVSVGSIVAATGPLIASGAAPSSVLLVEDDHADAVLVEELIADCGLDLRLEWVRTVADARDRLSTSLPDCVLLDLHLPDAHGLDALARVLDVAERVAVVVLTGLAEERTGLAALAAGAQDYLVKGRVEAELFGRAVRYAIQRKQAELSAAAMQASQLQAAAELQASQLRAQENARLERGLLPKPLLRNDGGADVVCRYRPGRAHAMLGGDFYDVVQRESGAIHAVIGDVSGHGPDEAALGVALRLAWRTLVLSGVTDGRQLELLEQMLVAERSGPQTFATLTTVVLEPGRARIARAGHPGMLVCSGAGVDWLEVPGGLALGIAPGWGDWPVHEVPLAAGVGLMMFTDGLFESHAGPGDGRLGEEGLLRLARTVTAATPADFVDGLIGRVEALAEEHGGFADDVAVTYLSTRPGGAR